MQKAKRNISNSPGNPQQKAEVHFYSCGFRSSNRSTGGSSRESSSDGRNNTSHSVQLLPGSLFETLSSIWCWFVSLSVYCFPLPNFLKRKKKTLLICTSLSVFCLAISCFLSGLRASLTSLFSPAVVHNKAHAAAAAASAAGWSHCKASLSMNEEGGGVFRFAYGLGRGRAREGRVAISTAYISHLLLSEPLGEGDMVGERG